MSDYLQDIADQHNVPLATILEAQKAWNEKGAVERFQDFVAEWILQHPFSSIGNDQWTAEEQDIMNAREAPPINTIKVSPDSPVGRSLQQALRLLQQQPVGTASNILIEAALQWALVQRENALLRIENEDLKLRLAAAGVQLP